MARLPGMPLVEKGALTFTDKDCFPGQAMMYSSPALISRSWKGGKHSLGGQLLSVGLPIISDSFAGLVKLVL